MAEIDPQTVLNETADAATVEHRTAAALCCAFYKNFDTGQLYATFPPGWNEILRVDPKASGYDGIALHHPSSRTLVIVNRGTEASGADWWQNIGAVVHRAPGPQMWDAHRLVMNAVARANELGLVVEQVLFTGHSLGGALAEVQAMVSPSLLPDALKDRMSAVGIASAGFGQALKSFARINGLTLHPDPAGVITHYVRRRDIVATYKTRRVYGREVAVASVYETRFLPVYKSPSAWKVVFDFLANHSSRRYLQYLATDGETQHLWLSRQTGECAIRDGAEPDWKQSFIRPDDY